MWNKFSSVSADSPHVGFNKDGSCVQTDTYLKTNLPSLGLIDGDFYASDVYVFTKTTSTPARQRFERAFR